MSRTNGQRTEGGKWKIEQCSGGPETAKCNFYKSSFEIKFAALFSSNMYSTDTMGNLPMSEVCKKVFRGWDLGMCASGQEILF